MYKKRLLVLKRVKKQVFILLCLTLGIIRYADYFLGASFSFAMSCDSAALSCDSKEPLGVPPGFRRNRGGWKCDLEGQSCIT